MTYEAAAQFAQTWGLVYAMLLFSGALAYALWPRNKSTFDRAAHIPLDRVETLTPWPEASQRGQSNDLGRFPTVPADPKRSESALDGEDE